MTYFVNTQVCSTVSFSQFAYFYHGNYKINKIPNGKMKINTVEGPEVL